MNRLKIVVTLIFLIFSFLVSGQEKIKKYVRENAVPLSSIDPDSLNYSDLQEIGKAIGEARVVMLGEQDHGDGPGYHAKTRLIKYLHEKKGFNVVAFEADFFNINYHWGLVKTGRLAIDSFIESNISVTWKSCGASSPLLF